MPATQSVAVEALAPLDNVITFRLAILPRHEEHMARWLEAGRPMGLSDAGVYPPEDGGPATEFVLVWVRENSDPAYMIVPDGRHWTITDYVRSKVIARERSFEKALHTIRPVLPMIAAA